MHSPCTIKKTEHWRSTLLQRRRCCTSTWTVRKIQMLLIQKHVLMSALLVNIPCLANKKHWKAAMKSNCWQICS